MGYERIDGRDPVEVRMEAVEAEVEVVEEHVHNRERWFGIKAVPTATDWADNVLAPFVAISGADTYGADADDEAAVFGTADTPATAGMTKFDIHRLLVVDVDHDTPYKLRLVWGTGTMDDAVTAEHTTEVMVMFDAANPTQSAGTPVDVMCPRLDCGVDQLWIQAWNATDDSEIDFLIGIHEYAV